MKRHKVGVCATLSARHLSCLTWPLLSRGSESWGLFGEEGLLLPLVLICSRSELRMG